MVKVCSQELTKGNIRRGRWAYTCDRGTWVLHAVSVERYRCTLPSEVHPFGIDKGNDAG